MEKAKLNVFVTMLLLTMITAPAMAGQADYQSEVGYELQQLDYANSSNLNLTVHSISFEYFLETVKIENQPLAEAAFMNRVSSLVVGLGQFDIDADNRTGDGNFTVLQYTHMQQGSALWLQVLYGNQSSDTDFNNVFLLDYSYDRTISAVAVGSFIAQNTVIAFEYVKDEIEYSPAAYADNDATLTRTNFTAKHLMPASNGTMVNIEGTLGIDSYDNKGAANTRNTVIGVKGEYYLNNMQSIGGTFNQLTGDDNGYKGRAIAVHGKFFVTTKFSFTAQINQFSGDGTSDDYDDITINANIRF